MGRPWLFVTLRPTRVEKQLTAAEVQDLLYAKEKLGSEDAKRAMETTLRQLPSAFDFAPGKTAEATVVVQAEQGVPAAAGSAGETQRQMRHPEIVPSLPDEDGEQRFEVRRPRSWRTAKLSSNPADHRTPVNGEPQATDDGMGVFLLPSADNIDRDDAFEIRSHANAELIYPAGRAKFFASGPTGEGTIHRAKGLGRGPKMMPRRS